MILGHGPLDPAGTLPLLMLVGLCVQLHHVGGAPAPAVTVVMLSGVVTVDIFVPCENKRGE